MIWSTFHITITWRITPSADNSHAKDDIEIFFLIGTPSESFIVLCLLIGQHGGECIMLAAHGLLIEIAAWMVGVKAAKLHCAVI